MTKYTIRTGDNILNISHLHSGLNVYKITSKTGQVCGIFIKIDKTYYSCISGFIKKWTCI